jgi:hypothetical protein
MIHPVIKLDDVKFSNLLVIFIMNLLGDFMKSRIDFEELDFNSKTLSSIIPTIVSGLYNDTFDLVREYCQNSYDAIVLKYGDDAKTKGRIDITIEKANLIIHDNGTGMANDVMKKCATIGYSSKDVNNQVGYRGVGRLSGICAADKIHFVSKVQNSISEYLFEIDANKLCSSLDRQTKFNERASEIMKKFSNLSKKTVSTELNKKSYTTVVLYGVHGEAGKILNETKLRKYLEVNLPVPVNPKFKEAIKIDELYNQYEKTFPNIPIFLNNERIYKPFHELEGKNKYKTIELKNLRGKKLAVAWFVWNIEKSRMIQQERIRGFKYRHKGFTIGDNAHVRSILDTSPPQIPDWFVGEILILDDRAKVSSDRSRFEDTISRSEIEDLLKTDLSKKIEKIAREKSNNASNKRVIVSAKTQLQNVKKVVKFKQHLSKSELSLKIKKAKEEVKKIEKFERKRKVSLKDKKDIKLIKNDISGCIKEIYKKKRNDFELGRILNKNEKLKKLFEITSRVIKKRFDKCESYDELLSDIERELIKKLS